MMITKVSSNLKCKVVCYTYLEYTMTVDLVVFRGIQRGEWFYQSIICRLKLDFPRQWWLDTNLGLVLEFPSVL